MGYTTDCDDCGRTGAVPMPDEEVVRGTKLYRTINDEWEMAALTARFSEDAEERDRAERRMGHLAKWEHYCPEHAAERGIAPGAV